jgi:hypothetical protein
LQGVRRRFNACLRLPEPAWARAFRLIKMAGKPGENKDENWFTETKKKIRDAFQLFDKDRKGCVIQEEVSTIMRYLGAYPTERAMVKEILPDMMASLNLRCARRARSLTAASSRARRAGGRADRIRDIRALRGKDARDPS